MSYCPKCGDRMSNSHTCDPVSLEAMRRNPFLALLMDGDGNMKPEAPIILGGGDGVPLGRISPLPGTAPAIADMYLTDFPGDSGEVSP